jgi:6-pyruvoyltetrahydropterin/6-carboxytetrahydropterin synthase
VIEVTRRYRFPAAHILRSDRLSDAENESTYGKCANPNGHGHDYGVEVTVAGEVDPRSGQICPPAALDAIFDERIASRFTHRMLNDDPAFEDRVPTAENIARTLHEQLEAPIAARFGARLVRIRVIETRKNSFVYGDPQ